MSNFDPCAWLRAPFNGVLQAIATLLAATIVTQSATAVEDAAAAAPPFNIHVLVSDATAGCFNELAIKRMTLAEQDRINIDGGVAGRRIQVVLHDNPATQEALIEDLARVLADPHALGIVGLSDPDRAKFAFAAHLAKLEATAIPFISDLPLDVLSETFPNLYTMRVSLEDDIVPILAEFSRDIGARRPAFVGETGRGGLDGLRTGLGAEFGGFVTDIVVNPMDGSLAARDIPAVVSELKAKRPDLVFLFAKPAVTAELISKLKSEGETPALFVGSSVTGDVDFLKAAKTYPNAIYNLNWGDPPEVLNDRLKSLVARGDPNDWVFEGRKNAAECKDAPVSKAADPFVSAKNLLAVSKGSKFADMVAFIAKTAQSAEAPGDIGSMRASVLKGLGEVYKVGENNFQGTFETWSFVPKRRSAAFVPLINVWPQTQERAPFAQLAQFQFVRSKDGSLRPMDTVYLDIDLIKAQRVNEYEKTFFAEFFLSMRNKEGASLDRIEFSNAVLDSQAKGGRQISIEQIHPGGPSKAYPETMKIYKISGRFLFEPKLEQYPFDTQRFSIDIQPKDFERPFIVQPPPLKLRDKLVVSDGWKTREQYVGYDRGFVPMIDAFTHATSVVPYYQVSFVWLMKRQATDYYLRVAVPLGFILFVAYISIFIPKSHFEAIVTIQVTALLSAVALYLSLPGLVSDTPTRSDLAFVMAYMVLSMMIGISIMRITPPIAARPALGRTLQFAHIAGIPAALAVIAIYIFGLNVIPL